MSGIPKTATTDNASDHDMESLLIKIRQLETENRRLKEKAAMKAPCIFQTYVKFHMPKVADPAKDQPRTVTLKLGEGTKMVLAVLRKADKVEISSKVKSSHNFDATIIMKGAMSDSGTPIQPIKTCLIDFLRLFPDQYAHGSNHTIDYPLGTAWRYLRIDIRMIRMEPSLSIPPDPENSVRVVVENKEFSVDVLYVSKWSQFLQAFFASNMKEKESGVYLIKDCSAVDFFEMLEVIYPSSKAIDEKNVEAMLDLGDRFIMPMLTRKCEIFLSKTSSHEFTEMQTIIMADRFNLINTVEIVLENLGSTELLRSKIINAGYEALSPEMQRQIDARFVKLDKEEKERKRSYYRSDSSEYSD